MERQFYNDLERIAKNFNTTPETIINNILVWVLKSIRRFINSLPHKSRTSQDNIKLENSDKRTFQKAANPSYKASTF
jgi:hypothetical protein